MLGSRSTTLLRTAVNIQRRNAGGFLKKNIRVEENAGLREASYKTWEFTVGNVLGLTFGLALPSFFLYNLCIDELIIKDRQAGNPERKYGVFFSLDGRKVL